MKQGIRIVRARPDQARELSELAQLAKAHWGYPKRWLKAWRPQLTLTPSYLKRRWVMVAMDGSTAVGLCAMRPWRNFAEVDHLWVTPRAMGRGVGRALFERAAARMKRAGFSRMRVISDPNAEGFYRRIGGQRVGVSRSRLEGRWRELPVLHFDLRPEK